jgi:L-fuculose-phosphate aldolase
MAERMKPLKDLSIEELDRLFPGYLTDEAAKLGILQAGRRLHEKGYTAANDGNISCLVAPGEIWATPTGVSKGYMNEDMLIKVDQGGGVLEGSWAPSTELMMHLRVYQENPNARAAIHAHSPIATAFACAGIALDQPVLAEAATLLGPIPVAPFAMPGTSAVADSIAPYLRDYRGVLLANHGVLTWGPSLTEALYRMERVEYVAALLMRTGYLPQPAKQIPI